MIVYGFFYNSCIYESADALMSLHLTKKGAYKAMREHRLGQYDQLRALDLRGWKKNMLQTKEVDWKTWAVRPVEVLE